MVIGVSPKYSVTLTPTIFSTILPHAPAEALAPLNQAIIAADLRTPQRVAHFLSQTAFESASYTRLVENLNYSAEGLLRTFPTHFSAHDAAAYAHQPERIANRAYASRMGNGPEASGDGWRYRGRGCVMITGKANYIACAKWLKIGVDDLVNGAGSLPRAMDVAAWFWTANNINKLADGASRLAVTKAVNGGLNGAADRLAIFEKAMVALV